MSTHAFQTNTNCHEIHLLQKMNDIFHSIRQNLSTERKSHAFTSFTKLLHHFVALAFWPHHIRELLHHPTHLIKLLDQTIHIRETCTAA
ncbi:hypothetical protein D3C85_1705520 [compost metagenome]